MLPTLKKVDLVGQCSMRITAEGVSIIAPTDQWMNDWPAAVSSSFAWSIAAFRRAQVVDAVDHRQKNGDRMRRAQPKDGPQLRVQQLGMREQQPDAPPKAHGRIGFAVQRKVAERFVTADIENADHRLRRLQVLRRGAVELVLLVFRGGNDPGPGRRTRCDTVRPHQP
nr:hypothetical protein [Candidatus Accumulibacter sp. ACC012]